MAKIATFLTNIYMSNMSCNDLFIKFTCQIIML